jgi:uncharacterized OB-fold protein
MTRDGPFLDGLRLGELRVQVCDDCGTCQLGQIFCGACGGERLGWRAASGAAKLHSFVTVRITYHPAFPAPYEAALAELVEGPRLFTRVGAHASPLTVGCAGRVEIIEVEKGSFAPVFVPAA